MNDSALLLVTFYKRVTDSGVFIFLIFSYFIKITTSVGVTRSPTSAYIIYNLF
jgi:hypothetical protein